MALLKEIELDNGVVVKYHRLVSINKITNHSTILEIASYINEEKRNKELAGETTNIYKETEYMSVDYNEVAEITDWYNYLKTTGKYSGAEDV